MILCSAHQRFTDKPLLRQSATRWLHAKRFCCRPARWIVISSMIHYPPVYESLWHSLSFSQTAKDYAIFGKGLSQTLREALHSISYSRGRRNPPDYLTLTEDAKKSDMTPILYIEGQAKALLCTLKAEYLCLGSYTGDGSERLPATGRIGAQRQPVNTRS